MNFALVLAAASAVGAATPAAAPAASSALVTVQEKFNQASDDAAAGRCAEAVALFSAIENDPTIKPGSIPAAMIAVRKGMCLARTSRSTAGEVLIRRGLPILANNGGFPVDLAEGWGVIGDLAFQRHEYAAAAAAYRRGLETLQGPDRINLLSRLSKATMFDGAATALTAAEEALAIAGAEKVRDKQVEANLRTLHARALMNQGRFDEAYKGMKTALALNGGLTASKVSLTEVSLRSDLALAALKVGRKDDARLYLAYTGAGRIAESPFASAQYMEPPLCGDETGLRADDVAVVEFSIEEDGTVATAHAVHTLGSPQVAAAFGKAVTQWRWSPESIAKLPAFYRLLTRVELRCSNVLGSGPGVTFPLDQRFLQWAKGVASAEVDGGLGRNNLSRMAAALDASPGVGGTARVAKLALVGVYGDEPLLLRVRRINEALTLAKSENVPVEASNWVGFQNLIAELELTGISESTPRYVAALMNLSSVPKVADDALAADTLLLLAARAERDAAQRSLLAKRVAEDERLPAQHPLRQLAWLRLADEAAGSKDFTSAQTFFERTGLTEEQCTMLGVKPELQSSGAGRSDYPMAALMMGFEGWVRLEFDVTADGRTAGVRPLVAYPPFVFVDAAQAMSRDFRYRASYRPETQQACSANRETIRFIIPSNH